MVQTDTDRRMGLNLNISHYSLAKPLSQFLNDVSKIKDNHSKLFEIDGYVGKLEEERKKIDVFKRELPLCMLLMNEGVALSILNFVSCLTVLVFNEMVSLCSD